MADPATLVRCLDLTLLDPGAGPDAVRELCRRAIDPGAGVPPVASVCVLPGAVADAHAEVRGSDVAVGSVSAFPDGTASRVEREYEIECLVHDGADEVDAVLAPDALEDPERAADEVRGSKVVCGDRTLKVILETGRLATAERIRRAASIAIESGADFLKTSTGRFEPGATPGAVEALCNAIAEEEASSGRRIGVKVAGGIRTADQAAEYASIVANRLGDDRIHPWWFRIGASALLDDLVRAATEV